MLTDLTRAIVIKERHSQKSKVAISNLKLVIIWWP